MSMRKWNCASVDEVMNPVYDFELLGCKVGSENTLLRVKYPNCTSMDGIKVLIVTNEFLRSHGIIRELDPHFTEDGNIVMRFHPCFKIEERYLNKLLGEHVFDIRFMEDIKPSYKQDKHLVYLGTKYRGILVPIQ